jgi:hypothetical protein
LGGERRRTGEEEATEERGKKATERCHAGALYAEGENKPPPLFGDALRENRVARASPEGCRGWNVLGRSLERPVIRDPLTEQVRDQRR